MYCSCAWLIKQLSVHPVLTTCSCARVSRRAEHTLGAHGSMLQTHTHVEQGVECVFRWRWRCVLSGKWHMSGHMFQAPGGPALCSSCSLHLSQILYPSPRSVSLLVVSLPRFLSLSLAPRGSKRGCLIQSDISHGPLMGLLV